MAEAYILEACRTAIGRRKGSLSGTRPDELAAINLKALIDRTGVDAGQVEDVIMGCVTQIGEQGMNIARMAALEAGFPVSVAGTTVNRMCASSLQSVNFAAQAVMAGQMDLTIGAGVETMSRVTMGSDGGAMSPMLSERFHIIPQGLSAELMAEKWGLSRETIDQLSSTSHERAFNAIDNGYFEREIIPVEVTDPEGNTSTFEVDECPRLGSTPEKLAGLKPAFKSGGMITAGNASQISDGACAMLIGSGAKAEELGLKPRARFVATAVVGTDPTLMLSGPIPATAKVLKRAGLELADIDIFEVNEAFASVLGAWLTETGADHEKTNVNGGAVALGHPLGCSGARLLTTALYELERREQRYALATLCIGFGMAVATIIERI
jgi:acetyl-CoA acetyltransferase family protein